MKLFSLFSLLVVCFLFSGDAIANSLEASHSSKSPNISVTVDGRSYQCSGSSGSPQIVGVEMFGSHGCQGDSRWGVRNQGQCSDGNRPDFYCSSARLVFSSGATFCMSFDRMEEDACCRRAFGS